MENSLPTRYDEDHFLQAYEALSISLEHHRFMWLLGSGAAEHSTGSLKMLFGVLREAN
jgi:hypothetical protein